MVRSGTIAHVAARRLGLRTAGREDPQVAQPGRLRRCSNGGALEVDPATMGVAVGLFERYALGNVSAARLEAETGLAASGSG